jgi:hypothetical protein
MRANPLAIALCISSSVAPMVHASSIHAPVEQVIQYPLVPADHALEAPQRYLFLRHLLTSFSPS